MSVRPLIDIRFSFVFSSVTMKRDDFVLFYEPISQEMVRRRQQAFRKTEEEIEARLAEEEEKEEQRGEEQYSNKQQENHTGNTSCRETGMFRQTTHPYVAARRLSVTS